ncbi:MAG: glutamate--tRNA ligase [Oscillospiraceae bacterium]|jgi:glutamyl-tRNA synthetase|nr:glutamate--tRNA ligase [Oscillospiraceae bacterium]
MLQTPADSTLCAALFAPDSPTVEALEAQYPPRELPEGAAVTRFAPSPTGFLHFGGLFGAFADRLTASGSGGVFILRIEDTDKKREVEDGVSGIVEGLRFFCIKIDEGVVGFEQERGAYGPYTQSRRRLIYHAVAKRLVEQGLAYPCFCTEEELDELRARQETAGVNKGYYGKWTRCRDLPLEEQLRRVRAGEAYTLRLRSQGDGSQRITVPDLIRGKLELPENNMDVVLLKADGIPTYHFAHVVDDHFMRVTHVIRSDEWLANLPLHIALFRACGFKPPKYAHTAPVMKEENGGKRKLSKRRDPEAAVSYFAAQGYPPYCVQEYLLTLLNSGFEDWRRANPRAMLEDYPFQLKKLSPSGALFDLPKLEDVCKNVLALYSAEEVYALGLAWAKEHDAELAALLERDPDYAKALLSIDRGGAKPRKDLARMSQLREYVSYFYDALYQPGFTLPEHIAAEDAARILAAYARVYSPADDKETWFAKIKALCAPLGFSPDVKEFKRNPGQWKGHVGDVTTVLRLAVTARRNTPDLWAIMRALGEERLCARLQNALALFAESHIY